MKEFVGVDVAKDSLMCWHGSRPIPLKNNKTDVRRFLRGLDKQTTAIGIECTSTYHLLMANEAVEAGFTVYVLNPIDCARYRQALHGRGKTDAIDSEMIARFVKKEHDSMKPYVPLPQDVTKLRNLIGRRDKVVKALTLLEQSFASDAQLSSLAKPALKRLRDLISKIEDQMQALVKTMEGADELQSIPSVGIVNQACLLSVLSVGSFKSADAFVAYCGLDCRPRESGTLIGKRFVTKRGSVKLRKNLYMSAMGGCLLKAWKPYYQKQLDKGLSRTQALVALARKIARTAWSVYTYRRKFDATRISAKKA